MKGSVYQRGSTWYYKFRGPDRDPATGDYPWITKGGFDTKKEAWKACREAMRQADRGRVDRPSTRTVAQNRSPDSSSVLGFSLCDNEVGCFEAPVRTWRFRSISDHWR